MQPLNQNSTHENKKATNDRKEIIQETYKLQVAIIS